MLYFLTIREDTKQLEAYTPIQLKFHLAVKLGNYVKALTSEEQIDEINKYCDINTLRFVGWNKKDAIKTLKEWNISNKDIKQLFRDVKIGINNDYK